MIPQGAGWVRKTNNNHPYTYQYDVVYCISPQPSIPANINLFLLFSVALAPQGDAFVYQQPSTTNPVFSVYP
jgi:hypothetical protein